MKILQLCHKSPYPPTDGGAMAIRNLTEGLLRKGADLRLLMIETHKHPFSPEELPAGSIDASRVRSVFVETELDPVEAFTSLVNRDPYNVSRFFSPDLDQLLIQELETEEPDIVQLESLFMAPYIDTVRSYSDAKVVLRSHNLEHRIWQRIARGSSNPLKKAYLRLLSRQLEKYEKKILQRVDGLVSISEDDRKNFERMGAEIPSVTVPYALDTELWAPRESSEGRLPRFFHLGSMDWIPNQEAVDHLLDEIWPIVRERMPDAELVLIGKNMDRSQEDVPEGVRVLGEVDDVIEAIREHGIMLVPLLSGSGIRVRIIQGMALEKPIVSTPVGASGIDCHHGRELLIAKGAERFAEAMVELAEDPSRRGELGRSARQRVLEHYDEGRAIDRLMEFYEGILQKVS
jgi:glycosyltransferase involved in cell wall biosynthesis